MSDAYLPLKFGNYLIEELIGQGGMGVVYRARHTYLDRPAALKIVHDFLVQDPLVRERFLREAQVAALLKHRNLAQVYDFGEDDGHSYLAMEFIDGRPLDDILRRGLMQPARALTLLEQIATALDYIHQQGVVHRDLKPSNVMVTIDEHVSIVDFGIARALESTTVGREGQLVGTLAYCAPEQLQGDALSPSVDGYALGVIAFEMLTGRPPFQADTPQGLIWGIAFEPPPPARQLRPDMPEAVEQVLMKQLAKDPADRYPNATAFVTALRYAARHRPFSTLDGLKTTAGPASGSFAAPISGVQPVVAPAQSAPVATARPSQPRLERPLAGVATPPRAAWIENQRPVRRSGPTPRVRAAQPASRAPILLALLALFVVAAGAAAIYAFAAGASAAATAAAAAEGADVLSALQAAPLVFGPASGQLGMEGTPATFASQVAGVSLADIVARATFTNPATSGWNYGMIVRDSGLSNQYRLSVSPPGFLQFGAAGRWELRMFAGNSATALANGTLAAFSSSPGAANTLVLAASGPAGYLWVNDAFVAKLDLSGKTTPGDVWVATGLYDDYQVSTKPVGYRDFTVRGQ